MTDGDPRSGDAPPISGAQHGDNAWIGETGQAADLRAYLKRRVRNSDDLDDMVQDVYLRVLSTPQAGIIENTRGFLRRVASNLLIDNHRRKAARMVGDHMPLDEGLIDDRVATPDRIVEARQELGCLGRELETVSPMARDAFLLVRVEGYSHKEAAKTLGITPKAVSHHVERTLVRLAASVLEPAR